jgi:hypothetical protein
MGTLYKRGAVWWIKYYQNGVGMRECRRCRAGDLQHF